MGFKLIDSLVATKKDLEKKKAERIFKSAKRSQEKLIDDLLDERDGIIKKKEELEEVTIDTYTDNWCNEYQNVQVNLTVLERKIQVAVNTAKEVFGMDISEYETK